MNNTTVFNFGEREIRTVLIYEEPWFVAKDVGDVLKLTNIRANIASLDDDEKGVNTIYAPSGEQEMTIINESGLYSLILRSRKPEAKAFKKWVTSEVLPAIRKQGLYSVAPGVTTSAAPHDVLDTLARALLLAQETISRLQTEKLPETPAVPAAETPPVTVDEKVADTEKVEQLSEEKRPADPHYWMKQNIPCTLVNKITGEERKFSSIRSAMKFLGYKGLIISRRQAQAYKWGDWYFKGI